MNLLQSFRQNRTGLTLVEAIIAVGIFGIAIAGMCGLVVSAKETGDRARLHYAAINIGKNRIEKARSLDFSLLPMFRENLVVVDVNGESPIFNGPFRRTTTVTNVAVNLAEIVVTVDIRNKVTLEFGGEQESVRTYIADYVDPTQ